LAVSGFPATVLTNAPFNITITAEDDFGNTDPAFQGSVTLALPAHRWRDPGRHADGHGGQRCDHVLRMTLTRWAAATPSGHQSGVTAATSSPFNATEQLVVTTPPPKRQRGTAFDLMVSVEDGTGMWTLP